MARTFLSAKALSPITTEEVAEESQYVRAGRISVGIEDVDDIIADLDQALEAI